MNGPDPTDHKDSMTDQEQWLRCDHWMRSALPHTTSDAADGRRREVVRRVYTRRPDGQLDDSQDARREVSMLDIRSVSPGAHSFSARADLDHWRDGHEVAMAGSRQRLSDGTLNAALANELGKLVADFTGRGATRSRAFVHQDLVICLFEDAATRAERHLVAAGKSELVRFQRDALQRAMGPQLVAAVERLTERTVRTFLSGTDEDGGSSIEAFVLEPEPGVADQGESG
jgi:uncharacterized protein YbcI